MNRLALDHDSTLAATSEMAFELMLGPDHGYGYENVESWNWGLDTFGAARFLSGMWHAWTLRPLEVPPMEAGLSDTVDRLRDEYEVHIVTAHPDHFGIEDGKKEWLDYHGITYDDFVVVPMDQTKATLGYDVYVDDKPALPAEVNASNPDTEVYLRDQRYNRDADGEYNRIQAVAEVLD